jgi:hypothetical protein
MEREIGQRCLEKMSLTRFVLDKEIYDFRISSLCHLYFETMEHLLFRSKLTVDELIN